jgi:predicted DNA binding CopG/RHH family protein
MSARRRAIPVRGKRPVPKFKSVEEESAFWDRHSILDFGQWEAVPYEKVCQEMGARAEPKLPVTLRVERALLLKLKRAARRYGVKYQALAREILWQSLSRKAQ